MKIVHICPQYTEGWTYQENYLPKYQKRLGNDVTIIASNYVFGDNNKMVRCDVTNYYNDDDVKIIRLKTKKNHSYEYKFRDFVGLNEALITEKPDVIFVHGVQFVYMDTIITYKKNNPEVDIYVDNHADFSNSATNWLSKNILHGIIWKHYAKKIDPYVKKWFGVLPARVDFLHDVYGISLDKIELLLMGADDDSVNALFIDKSRDEYRKSLLVEKNDFLIITGGKIDLSKQQILLLMDAVNKFKDKKIKLVVFGSVIEELREQVKSKCSEKVQYIGWINANESYELFGAADLIVFPGRHSVYWEQAVGLGKPMIVKYWEGTTHINPFDNIDFLHYDSVEEIYNAICKFLDSTYYMEKSSAAKKAKSFFLYSTIAEQSLR